MSANLEIGDTVPVGELRHRLALGLALVDALTGVGAWGPLRVDLESIGPYRFPKVVGSDLQPMRFEPHGADKHAKRYAGRVQKLLDRVVADAADTRWTVRVYALLSPAASGYNPARDARLHVPRRLRIALAFDGGQPAPAPLNIRTPWLWPGSAYPLPSTSTAIRGRVLRGATIEAGAPIRWTRVFATIPNTETDFAAATIVGRGHGDDRGEFVIALDRRAVSGAALTNPVNLRLWAFFPPLTPPGAADDPLDGLPVEDAGTDPINDVLRGYRVPAAYAQQTSTPVSVRLGETTSGIGTTLLFT